MINISDKIITLVEQAEQAKNLFLKV